MAARCWRAVLALQLVLAGIIGASVAAAVDRPSPWMAIGVAAGAMLALQYLLVAASMAASRILAGRSAQGGSLVETLRAALGETYYFALAELAMSSRAVSHADSLPRESRTVLLLVHGFACNARVWNVLGRALRRAGFDCIRAVNLPPFGVDLDTLAVELGREVQSLHRDAPSRRIVIVAHSMGGLVARAALRTLDPAMVRHIVTIGTPHHGAALARLLRGLPGRELRVDSTWIGALNAGSEGRTPVPITSVFSREDNLVQPAASPRLRHARPCELRGLGHFGLLTAPRAVRAVVRAVVEAG